MFIQYNFCDVDIPRVVNFPYPVSLHELLCYLIPGLPYPVKYFMHKSAYLFEINNSWRHTLSGKMISCKN